MGRLLRSLLKVPAVARQLKRIADLETAAAEHERRLSALDERIRGFSAERDLCQAQQAAQETILGDLETRLRALEEHAAPVLGSTETPTTQAQPEPRTIQRPVVEPYTFEQLLNRRVEPGGLDLVFHVHVPKAGGKTVGALLRQSNFAALDFDMNTKDFFRQIREDQWLESYLRPPPRPSYLLTGHFRLDLPMLRRIWIPHVIVTTLRHPVDRILSHYNYTLRVPDNPWRDDIVNKGMTFLEYAGNLYSAIGPQYSFFDDTGEGTFARTGFASPLTCLRNLLTRVAVFGLMERFDEFCVLVGYLLGRDGILSVKARNVTRYIPNSAGTPLKTSLSAEERNTLTELLKDDIWFYEEARKEYERRISDPRVQAVLSQALPLVASSGETLARLSEIRDPADPCRGAFQRV